MSCLSEKTIDQYLSLREPTRICIAKAVPEYRDLDKLSRDEWKTVVFYPGIAERFFRLLQYYVSREKMDHFWLERLTNEQRAKLRPVIINFIKKNKRCQCFEEITGLITCIHTDMQVMEHLYELMQPPLEYDPDAIVPLLHGIADRASTVWFIHVVRSIVGLPTAIYRKDIMDVAAAMVSSEKPLNDEQFKLINWLVNLKEDDPIWIFFDAFPRLTTPQREIVYGILGVESLSQVGDAFEKLNTQKKDILIGFIKKI